MAIPTRLLRSLQLREEGFSFVNVLRSSLTDDSKELDCRPGEGTRDRDQRVFTAIMQDELGMAQMFSYTLSLIFFAALHADAASRRVKWKDWLVTAWHNKLCLVDWPDDVPAPGPGFSVKKLGALQLRAIVAGYINQTEGQDDQVVPHMVDWSTGSDTDLPIV
jgi:hypothetical protein